MEPGDHQKPFLTESAQPRDSVSARASLKPWILKSPALILLLVITLSLIGLIEYAFHSLPSADNLGVIENALHISTVAKRADFYVSTVVTHIQGTTETLVVTYAPNCPPSSTCAPPPQYWLPVGTITIGPQKTPAPASTSTSSTSSISVTPPTAPPPQHWLPAPSLITVFTKTQYFVGAFLSTVLAVVFALPWIIIDARIKSLEPFHQLSSDEGASARKTLFMDYASPSFIVAPFKALLSGHWAPFITSILSICTIALTPIAPEFISIRVEGACVDSCTASLSVFPIAGRLLEAILAFMVALEILLIVILWRWHTGVFAEPHSIAGLATLFHNHEVLADFQGAVAAIGGSGENTFNPILQQRYRIDYYTCSNGSTGYGFVPLVPRMQPEHESQQYDYPHQAAQPLTTNFPHRTRSLGLLVLIIGLIVVIVYYKVMQYDNSGFEVFMDSQGFGVRFLFTFVGVVIARYWTMIFRDLATMEAFNNLSLRSSKASNSILLAKLLNPITSIFPTLLRGHLFTALVATCAFLAEVLTICLSNVHYNTSTTFTAFTVSTWLSCAILGVMILTLLAIAFHRQPKLPFKPNTIGAVLYFLCDSSLPERFEGMATWDGKLRNRRIREMEGVYGMWVKNTAQGGAGTITIDVETSNL